MVPEIFRLSFCVAVFTAGFLQLGWDQHLPSLGFKGQKWHNKTHAADNKNVLLQGSISDSSAGRLIFSAKVPFFRKGEAVNLRGEAPTDSVTPHSLAGCVVLLEHVCSQTQGPSLLPPIS